MPLWNPPVPGNPEVEDLAFASPAHETHAECGWRVDSADTQNASGFDKARRQLANAFDPDPVMTAYWGNSRSSEQCGSTPLAPITAASSGVMKIARSQEQFGFNERYLDIDYQKALDIIQPQYGHATVVRIPLNWSAVQPGSVDAQLVCHEDPGKDTWDTLVKPLYDAVIAHNMRPIFVVGAAPCWAYDDNAMRDGTDETCGGSTYVPPDDDFDSKWKDFVYQVADRFPNTLAIEVWNEPNFQDFWGGCSPQASRYAKLLEDAYDAVQEEDAAAPADHEIQVLMAGMNPLFEGRSNFGSGYRDWDTFLDAVEDARPGNDWDFIALHPYRRLRDIDQQGPRLKHQESATKQVAQALKTQVVRRPRDLWVTEVGASTTKKESSKLNQDPVFVAGGEGSYADRLVAIYHALRDENIRTIVFHRVANRPVPDPSGEGDNNPRERGSGILFYDFTCRFAYFELADARGDRPQSCGTPPP